MQMLKNSKKILRFFFAPQNITSVSQKPGQTAVSVSLLWVVQVFLKQTLIQKSLWIKDKICLFYPFNFIHKSKSLCLTFANGILLPKLFWPTVRKNCSSDREKRLKLEADGREFSKCLRSLKPLQNKKGQKNLGYPRKKQSFSL